MIFYRNREPQRERFCDAAQRSDARRQVSAHRGSRLHHRGAGAGPGAAGPEQARSGRRAEHGGLPVGLSRLAPRGARPAGPSRGQAPRRRPGGVQGGPERGPGRHRRLGQPAGQPLPRRPIRRRLRHVVRQGARRGPHGRRFQARQLRRNLAARGCGGRGRRRPQLQVLHPAVPVGVRLPGLRNAGSGAGRRAGGAGLRPDGLRPVAVLRAVGRADRAGRHHGLRHDDRRLPVASPVRPAPLRHARRRPGHPAEGSAHGEGAPPARLQDPRSARLRPGQPHRPGDARLGPAAPGHRLPGPSL